MEFGVIQINSTGNGKIKIHIKVFFSLLITYIDYQIPKAKLVTIYYEVIYSSKMDDNKSIINEKEQIQYVFQGSYTIGEMV